MEPSIIKKEGGGDKEAKKQKEKVGNRAEFQKKKKNCTEQKENRAVQSKENRASKSSQKDRASKRPRREQQRAEEVFLGRKQLKGNNLKVL